jgi:hypothetical protein
VVNLPLTAEHPRQEIMLDVPATMSR